MEDRGLRAAALAELSQRVVGCRCCPRLVAYREEVARRKAPAFRDEEYWGRPVPGFGDPEAWLLIVGLAPAAHGANRTGRMFTGDSPRGAGDFLMAALFRAGLANKPIARSRDDGLRLTGVFLTAVGRCAPPQNRLLPGEIENCLPFLVEELKILADVRVILALGQVAFNGALSALAQLGAPPLRPKPPFAHGTRVELGQSWPVLLASYHPSRQNTQTGRLTERMFDEVLREAGELRGPPAPPAT